MKVKRTDSIDLGELARDLGSNYAEVGFFDSAKYPDGTSVAYIASIQEFGYAEGNIPSRPFFRNAIKANEKKWEKAFAKLVRAATMGKLTGEQALNQLGIAGASAVQESMVDGEYIGLSSSTIRAREKRKRTPGVATKPLIDTAQMLQSVSYCVSGGDVIPVDKGKK